MADYLYIVQMDIPADKEADFNRIYDTQHVPNILTVPGVESCTRFKLWSADVDGIDAAYKPAVLSSLAFHTAVNPSDIYREGIRKLTPADFRYAAELGYAIKLLATSRRVEGGIQARVHPAFLPKDHPLAKVDGVYNAVELEGDLVD